MCACKLYFIGTMNANDLVFSSTYGCNSNVFYQIFTISMFEMGIQLMEVGVPVCRLVKT